MNINEFSKKLEIDVPRETWGRFCLYVDILKKWQMKINLISPKTIPDIWERHILDSAQLFKYIESKNSKITDLGSGAGFPALVLAIMGTDNITMIEADRKKCAFLREIIRKTNTKAKIINSRIENYSLQDADIVTARALSSLDSLLKYSYPILKKGGFCLFQKGKNFQKEVKEAKKNWNFQLEAVNSITDADARILKISNIVKT